MKALDLQPPSPEARPHQLHRIQVAGILTINSSSNRHEANCFLNKNPDITALIEKDSCSNFEVILADKGIIKQELKIHPRLHFVRLVGPQARALHSDHDPDPKATDNDASTNCRRLDFKAEAENIKTKINLETAILQAARSSYASRMGERQRVVSTLHKLRHEVSRLQQEAASTDKHLNELRCQRIQQRCQLDEEWKLTNSISEKLQDLLKKKETLLNRYLQEIHDVDVRIGQEDERITTFLEVEKRQKLALQAATEKMEKMREHREQLEDIHLKQQDQIQLQRNQLAAVNKQISANEDVLKNQELVKISGEQLLREYNCAIDTLQRLVLRKEETFDCYERSLEALTHQTNLTIASLNNEGTNLASVTQSGVGLRQIANILVSLNNERSLLVRRLSRESTPIPQVVGVNLDLSPFPFCQTHRRLTDKPCPTPECSIPNPQEVAQKAVTPDYLQGHTNQFHHQPLAFLPQREQLDENPEPEVAYGGSGVPRPTWPTDFPRPLANEPSNSASTGDVVVDLIELPRTEEAPPGELLAQTSTRSSSIVRSRSCSRSVTRSPCENETENHLISPRSPSPQLGHHVEVTTSAKSPPEIPH